jgi:O-antigen/teichoic acid export membrane protein
MKDITEKIWSGVIGFFVLALLCFISAKLLLGVWWVLLIAAAIAIGVILYIRFKKKPKY